MASSVASSVATRKLAMKPHRGSERRRIPRTADISLVSSASTTSSLTASLISLGSSIEERRRGRRRAQPAAAEHPRRAANKHKELCGAIILALCVFNIFEFDVKFGRESGGNGRRSLLSSLYLAGPSTLLPWAQHHLVDVTDRPDTEAETALFWHIPKSGGTTAKRLYQCMGQTLAHRVGGDPRNGHDQDSELLIFEPHAGKDWKVANVDTTIKPGILRAKDLGLVQSHTTDLIFTMEPQFAGVQLYDEQNKGRFLGLFRHPVDRALSMFYYLQTATWERTYRPEWANMTVLEWANLPNAERDYMVHKLVDKKFGETVDETDLIIAKELVRQRFVVGLMVEMNESIRRFNIVLGVDEKSDRSQQCMEQFGLLEPKEDVTPVAGAEGDERKLVELKQGATDNKNSNKHPKFEEGSPEFDIVAGRNRLDMLLFKYVETLFDSQKEIIDSYQYDEEYDSQDRANVADEADEAAEVAPLPPGLEALAVINNPLDIQDSLTNVADPIGDSASETPFFWHVPKSGGTTLQRLYWCMGSTIANEVGTNPKFGEYHGELSDLVSFHPWKRNPGKVINVDVNTPAGILEAKNRGFLTKKGQPPVDFVATSEFQVASTLLFSPAHKARMFALFRHPIDRAVSKFYYLQKATWEPTYNSRWATMTLEEWASRDRGDNNWMVRHLVGKGGRDLLTTEDLTQAKEIISTNFVVGLIDKFEESVRRFNLLLGVDEADPDNRDCINEFSANQGDSHAGRNEETIVKKNEWNSYAHPEAERGSPAWVSLSKIHMYDSLLYRHVMELFVEQKSLFQPPAETENVQGEGVQVELVQGETRQGNLQGEADQGAHLADLARFVQPDQTGADQMQAVQAEDVQGEGVQVELVQGETRQGNLQGEADQGAHLADLARFVQTGQTGPVQMQAVQAEASN